MRSHFARPLAVVLLAALASSCDKGGEGTFTLALTDANIGVNQGKKDTIGITLSRADFGQIITLSVDGLPSGVVATFLPKTVPGNLSTSGLELDVAGTAAIGTTMITIRANASGKTEQIATANIAIGVTGNYTLSSNGFPLTAAQGGGGSGAILVVRSGGHADNVTLVASNVPSGVTASFYASPTTTQATALTLAVGAGVAPGAYPITITGTAPSLLDQTTQVTLNVIAPPATASFSMPFCASSVPAWFAYQNTGYPWQTITGVNGVFTFNATATVAVAYTYVISTAQANESDLNVLYATRTELAGKDARDCAGPKSLSGTVSGATTGQTTRIAMGAATASATFSTPAFNITSVADRALDLVATKGAITNTSSNLQVVPDLLLIQRNLNPATGTSLGTLDFAGQGFAPTASSLTIANLTANDNMNVGNTFWTGNTTYGVVHSFQPTVATSTLYSMPAAKFQAGDLHELLIETYQSGFSFGRVNVAYLGAITDRTETMAPNLTNPSVSVLSTAPYVRFRGALPVQAEYPTATRFIFFQGGGSSADRLVYIVATAAFLGATPASNWDVSIPEFGGASGLNNSWLPSNTLIVYQAEAYASPGAVLFGGIPTVGDIVKVGYRVATNGALLRAGLSAPALRASLKRDIETRQYLRR